MRILFSNNFFYERGGAEKSLFDTARLLEENGHDIFFFSSKFKENVSYTYEKYFTSDIDYQSHSIVDKLRSLSKIYYNFESNRKVIKLLKEIGDIDIAHMNNIMYRVGVSIVRTFKEKSIPVVYHLRDYNLMCGAISLTANGEICEGCKDFNFSNVLKERCKGGFTGSLAIYTSMVFYHKIMDIFKDVDLFISPSNFMKTKYLELGFNKNIEVLPNFINIEDFEPCYKDDGSYVYFGRLAPEKGIYTLLNICKRLPALKFKIIGAGPLEEHCKSFITENNLTNVRFLGYMSGKKLYEEIKMSKASIVPSEWYENNSKSIMESMALGKPVIASRIGGNPELVRERENGYLFEPFNEEDLVDKLMIAEKEGGWEDMGKRGREIIEMYYNPQIYYERLIGIYEKIAGGKQCHQIRPTFS